MHNRAPAAQSRPPAGDALIEVHHMGVTELLRRERRRGVAFPRLLTLLAGLSAAALLLPLTLWGALRAEHSHDGLYALRWEGKPSLPLFAGRLTVTFLASLDLPAVDKGPPLAQAATGRTVTAWVAGRALSDVRAVLTAASSRGSHEDITFLAWDSNHHCLQPLMPGEEENTAISALQGGTVVVYKGNALSGAAAASRVGGHYFWGEPLPAAASGSGKVTPPSGVCQRWVDERTLLAALQERRTFWVNLTGNEWNAVEVVGKDAMQYAGWRQTSSKAEAAIVIRGGTNDTHVFTGARMGVQAFLRHPFVSNITTKDLLFWHIKQHVESGQACFSLNELVPKTFLLDDPNDCMQALKEVQSSLPGASGHGWVRKIGPLHMGQGISMLSQMALNDTQHCQSLLRLRPWPELRSPADLMRGSRVLYQERLDVFKILDKVTSIRVYLLVASFSPLVVFFNHVAGHLYIGGLPITSDMAWYTQQKTFSAWTFEQFERYMAEQGHPDFFTGTVYPRIKNTLATVVAAMAVRRRFEEPGSGYFDLLCADFMLDQGHRVYLLEISDACMFKGYDQEHEQVRQRIYLMRDALDLSLDVTTKVLQRQSLYGPVIDRQDRSAMDGRFELLHYSGMVGDEPFDYLTLEQRCAQKLQAEGIGRGRSTSSYKRPRDWHINSS